MKILMISRSTLFSSPGGDTIQIKKTAEFLEKFNKVKVDIKLSNEKINYNLYNLIHFFNIIRPNDLLYHIEKSKLPFVISTIFVDYSEYESKGRKGVIKYLNYLFSSDRLEYLKVIARVIKGQEKLKKWSYLWLGQRESIRLLINEASLLLPNSRNEYKRLKNHFHATNNYRVIPNAIDLNIFSTLNNTINENYKDSIICIGRIEGRKNQLNLIKAVNQTNFKLFIIGKKSPNQVSYYNECIKEASLNNNIQFIEHTTQENLASIMRAAKIHALISWFETTGLVSLEAAYLGCNLVITDKGDQYEYFEDMATYCNPDNINSIIDALVDAYNKPFNKKLQLKIKNEYTWNKAAEKTYEAYQEVLGIK